MQFLQWCAIHKIELIIAAVAVALLVIIIGVIVVVWRRKDKGLFKFRRYKKYEGSAEKKAKHPKLIVEDLETEYGYMGLTESKKHGRNSNIPITNPVAGDDRQSYLRKPVEHDLKENFEEILDGYNLSKADIKAVKKYLRHRLKVKRQEVREQKRKAKKWRNRNKRKKK